VFYTHSIESDPTSNHYCSKCSTLAQKWCMHTNHIFCELGLCSPPYMRTLFPFGGFIFYTNGIEYVVLSSLHILAGIGVPHVYSSGFISQLHSGLRTWHVASRDISIFLIEEQLSSSLLILISNVTSASLPIRTVRTNLRSSQLKRDLLHKMPRRRRVRVVVLLRQQNINDTYIGRARGVRAHLRLLTKESTEDKVAAVMAGILSVVLPTT